MKGMYFYPVIDPTFTENKHKDAPSKSYPTEYELI